MSSGRMQFCCGGLMGWEKIIILLPWEIHIKQHQRANGCNAIYAYIVYRHACMQMIYSWIETNIIYVPLYAFPSIISVQILWLVSQGWHCAKVFPPVLWSLELSTYPSDTGMEIGLCSGSKSVSLSWYHVVSNILTCNAIELGTTLYIWYMQSIFGAFVSLHIF